jgi:hypothetical protein
MSTPQVLLQLTEGWARLYGTHHVLSNTILFLHLAGLLVGGGSAFAADRATWLAFGQDATERQAHLYGLAAVHRVVVGGLGLLAVSGILMFLADVETFWGARVFWVKMGLIGLLLVNGLVIQQAEGLAVRSPARGWRLLRIGAVVSVGLWLAVVLAGTLLANS